jgi:hypothetical protein
MLIILVLALIAIAIISSYLIILKLSGNSYGAIYITMSAMLDVNNEGFSQLVIASIPAHSAKLYELVSVLFVDGILKAVIVGLAIAWMIEIIGGIDIRTRLTRMIGRYTGRHILVCGYSELGEKVCDRLSLDRKKFIVVESNKERVEEAREAGYATIAGDFAEHGILEKAGIDKAKAVAFCTEDDFRNLLGVITARKANAKARVISKANTYLANAKMVRAGSSMCIMPEVAAGKELAKALGDK